MCKIAQFNFIFANIYIIIINQIKLVINSILKENLNNQITYDIDNWIGSM